MKEKMSSKDQKTLAMLVIVVLFGILAIWFPKAKAAWQEERKFMERKQNQYEKENRIIELRPSIVQEYEKLCASMPIFPKGKSVDTYWLPIMDESARNNNITIVQRNIGIENKIGEVTELTLECRDWEGRLDSLIHFLYDIETRDDAMMDMRQIYIRPNSKKPGFLQGTFTLNCAYMREE